MCRSVEPGPSVWAASAAWQDTSAPDDLDDHEPPEHLTWPEDGQVAGRDTQTDRHTDIYI